MEWLHTWSGRSFGWRSGDELRTHNGRHVGRFEGDEVYAPDGRYLGEVRNGRLITRLARKGTRKSGFAPRMSVVGRVDHVGYIGWVMIVGYEDFPSPDQLQR